jgi:hypothetical protein
MATAAVVPLPVAVGTSAVVAQPPADVEEQRVAVERLTVAEPDAAQAPVPVDSAVRGVRE